jgi:branched-subunit amino acid transport protein
VTGLWVAVLVASLGCYALKLAGLSVPDRVLARPVVQRVADLVPVVLLAALVAVQTLTTGERIVLDARLAGLAVGVAALLLRAPFLVVVAAAALTAALVRLL